MQTNTTIILPEKENGKQIKSYSVTEAKIEELRAQFMPLKINGIEDSKGAKVVYGARQVVKNLISSVENRRKELNEDYLRIQRENNKQAKQLTELLIPIRDHLKAEEDAFNNERERIKKEAEEKEQKRIEDRINKLSAYGFAVDYAEIKSMTDISFNDVLERARIEREKDLQAKAEAEELRKDQEEQLRKETEEYQKKRQELEYERNIFEAEKKAEENKKQKADREAEEKQRVEALKPDSEKLRSFIQTLENLSYPELKDNKAKSLLQDARDAIEKVQLYLTIGVEKFSVLIATYDESINSVIVE